MLTVITGNPGNGKSLLLVSMVEEMRLKDKREVYQNGIDDLVYPWHVLPTVEVPMFPNDPRRAETRTAVDWEKVPDSAIVVIDESWRVFPIRKQGSVVPEDVQFLATHRHRGLDIFLATQQVKTQLDTFVRGLAGKHIHMDRKFGMEYSMKYEWERIADPTSTKDLAVAQNSRWVFPKETYGQYKSAVEHTHKRNLPWKKFLTLGLALLCVVGGIGFAIHRLSAPSRKVAVDSSGRPSGAVAVNSGDFWIKDRRERVSGVPASAPVYDPLQKVKSQPRAEGCMEMVVGASVRCECTGPNHSVLAMSVPQCVELVKRGWFDETQKFADVKAANISFLNGSSAEDKKESKVE